MGHEFEEKQILYAVAQAESLGLVRDVIMATDMAHHSDFMSALRKHLATKYSNAQSVAPVGDCAERQSSQVTSGAEARDCTGDSESEDRLYSRNDSTIAHGPLASDLNDDSPEVLHDRGRDGNNVGDRLNLEDAQLYMQLLMKLVFPFSAQTQKE